MISQTTASQHSAQSGLFSRSFPTNVVCAFLLSLRLVRLSHLVRDISQKKFSMIYLR